MRQISKKIMFLLMSLCVLSSSVVYAETGTQNISVGDTVEIPIVLTTEASDLEMEDNGPGGGMIEPPSNLNIVVPTSLPVHVQANGTVVTATDAKITNNSESLVRVTSVQLEASDTSDWEIVDFATDFTLERVDSHIMGIRIRGDASTDSGVLNFNPSNWPTIDIGDENSLPLNYNVKLPMQTEVHEDVTIGNVIFVIELVGEEA